MDPAELKQAYTAALQAQAAKCQDEISNVLAKYRCTLQTVPRVYLDKDGRVKAAASFVIEPVELAPQESPAPAVQGRPVVLNPEE